MREEFLSEEYTIWLNTLFSRESSVVLQINYDMAKFKLLFKYVAEYLRSDLASPIEKYYYLSFGFRFYFNFTYNNKTIEVTRQTNGDLRSDNPVISCYRVAKLKDKTNIITPSIDLNKVREYVSLKKKNEEDETLNAIIKTIKELENKGIEREVIINDLQIAYAYVINKDIKEKQSSKER